MKLVTRLILCLIAAMAVLLIGCDTKQPQHMDAPLATPTLEEREDVMEDDVEDPTVDVDEEEEPLALADEEVAAPVAPNGGVDAELADSIESMPTDVDWDDSYDDIEEGQDDEEVQ